MGFRSHIWREFLTKEDILKILITGATGFLGGQLTQRLVNQGYKVCILRREHSSLGELKDLDIEHFIGDITHLSSIRKATQGVDVVCHLAGLVGYSKTMRSPMEKVNVTGTQNVIQACLENKARLVHISSVVAFGASFDKTIRNEQSPYNLSHLNLGYFETKKKAEHLVQQAVSMHQLDATILNPSTIYGPGDAKKGSRGIQLKVVKGQFPFYTSGGVNVVDVEDVTKAIESAIQNGRTGHRYIIAGDNILIKDLFHIIAKEAQSKKPYIYLPNFLVYTIGVVGDGLERIGRRGPLNSENARIATLYHWFDSSKAQEELGLQPKPARQAISKSVQWIKDNIITK